jgi:hypothetical protein
VRDADEPVASAERENHFRRSGQERNEARFSHSSGHRFSNCALDFHHGESFFFGKLEDHWKFSTISYL